MHGAATVYPFGVPTNKLVFKQMDSCMWTWIAQTQNDDCANVYNDGLVATCSESQKLSNSFVSLLQTVDEDDKPFLC